jgi:hypothetical protein
MRFSAPSILLAAVAAIGLSSCVYLIHGNTDQIEVTSDPPGADVVMSDGQTGVTPFTATTPRDQSIAFHFSKDGYEAADLTDHTKQEFWPYILGTFDVFHLYPLYAVDRATGADHEHETDKVSARLVPIVDGSSAAAPVRSEPLLTSNSK